MKVILVEDDAGLALGLVRAFEAEGFIVLNCDTGAKAIDNLDTFNPDVMVLDLGLPDMDGLRVLEKAKKKSPALPTLILTARDELSQKVTALDSGADDYLAKPFEMPELLARLRVMCRRLGSSDSALIRAGKVTLNTASHQLMIDGQEIHLPKKEYMTLKLLMEDVGKIKTKAVLEDNLYEWGETVGSNTIEFHISNLRKKLPPDFIKTIRGVGYTIEKKIAKT